MARHSLGEAALQVTQALGPFVRDAAERRVPVVLACSGGADSLALVAGFGWHLERADRTGDRVPPARVAIIDHQAQAGSRQVAERAAEQVRGVGLEADVIPVAVQPDGRGFEAAARDARHAVWELLDPAEIWLGHTRDDQAEGVLLGLARGSGARSLSGMAARRGRLVRPLLGLRRATTRAACLGWGLEPWDDPHNTSPDFLRSRVRHEVVPVMADVLGAGVVDALARSADLLRADADALDQLAADHAAPLQGAAEVELDALRALPDALASRVLRDWLQGHGARGLTATHLASALDLVRRQSGEGTLDLPGLRLVRRPGRVAVEQAIG